MVKRRTPAWMRQWNKAYATFGQPVTAAQRRVMKSKMGKRAREIVGADSFPRGVSDEDVYEIVGFDLPEIKGRERDYLPPPPSPPEEEDTFWEDLWDGIKDVGEVVLPIAEAAMLFV